MARASTYTLMPLDTWAQILGISPWDFNSCVYPAPKGGQCRDIFQQFPWQKDHLSREEVAQAIADAELMVANSLMYWPAPYYVVGEIVQYPRPYQRADFGLAGTWRGEWKTFGTRWHKVISGGVFNRTLINTIAGADLTASDLDGDGVKETFTATITDASIGTLTDINELSLYFVSGDRHGEPISETWRIRPIRISVAGNTATITGHRTLLIKPVPEFQVAPQDLDATDDSNYVTSVDCYRVFTDATATSALPYQGVAEWKNIPDCTQDCTFSIKELCLGEHDNEQGQIFASFGTPDCWPFPAREPDRLNINYVAGLPLVQGRMELSMARVVAYLSVSLLANEECGCNRTKRIFERWKAPIERFNDQSATATAFADSTTPFPMTLGGLFAWNRVKELRHIEAVGI